MTSSKNTKGFTLIELLAVVVVLAIITLIATLIILGVIDKVKKGAAESSALGYIDAIEKYNITNISNILKDGTYLVDYDELKYVKYKGIGPTAGKIIIKDGSVDQAQLCINKYSIEYKDNKSNITTTDFCTDDFNNEISLDINGFITKHKIGFATEMLINEDLSLYNSFTCNNGAQIDVQNNKIKLKNISTDTLCKTSNSIKTITDNIDDSENYILVLNDEIINDWIYIGKNKRLTIDL